MAAGTGTINQDCYLCFGGSSATGGTQDTLAFYSPPAGNNVALITNALYRDFSAWYHVVCAVDTTQATASNRILLYVNGVQITSFVTATYPTLNQNLNFNNTTSQQFAAATVTPANFFDGYLAEINFIDGQALTPSSFGQTNSVTGVWQPIKYGGTYGTNGFYLNFSDNSNNTATTIGKDYSGNGNNWTPNNISVTAGATYDSMLDSPTQYADGGNGRGNYCVMNPIAKSTRITTANGNLQATGDGTSNHQMIYGTFPITTGKWYWELTVSSSASSVNIAGIQSYIGFADGVYLSSSGNGCGWGYTTTAGQFYFSNFTTSGTAPVFANGTIAIAYDADAGKIWFRNTSGSWVQGDPATGTSPTGTLSGTATTMMPAVSFDNTSSAWTFNFGQQPFTYTPPTGFLALNSQNLSTPTISNGANYMAASTYTGNGSTQSIVNSGNNAGAISFKPDLVWIKSRSAATDHKLTDSVRGATKALISDTTGAETTDTNGMTAFNTGGFSVGTDTNYNNNTATYVAWQWQAGAGSSSSNTSGSITSTVSVNATAGFSVATYTGNGSNFNVGHGLGVAPNLIIVKTRNTTSDWYVYHSSVGTGKYLLLDTTAATATNANYFTGTSSTTWSGTNSATGLNTNGNTYVAYCFSAVSGYSAFGSYTGNGSADGPFIYCGFRPRLIMIKRSSGIANWFICDTSRDTYNVSQNRLFPSVSNAEATSPVEYDILSNGFKIRVDGATDVGTNGNGDTYIYAAFAENPFKYSLAR